MPDSPPSKSSQPGAAVLSFDSLSLHPSGPTERGDSENFDLTLREGELAFFEIPAGNSLPDISGLATGLTHPPQGEVKFRGTEWRQLDPISSGKKREHIGQVFQSNHRSHWITNLDVDENVYLAEQMTGRISQLDLLNKSKKLAQAFGLEEVPSVRESKVSRDHLMRAQWVRAFLPNPLQLLILECPTFGVPADAVRLLLEQVKRVREKHGAVIWIGPPLRDSESNHLHASHHIHPTPAALIPTSG